MRRPRDLLSTRDDHDDDRAKRRAPKFSDELKEVAGLLRRLSYRDMVKLGETLGKVVDERPAGASGEVYEGKIIYADMLIDVADVISSRED